MTTYTYFTAECCGPAFRQAGDKNICRFCRGFSLIVAVRVFSPVPQELRVPVRPTRGAHVPRRARPTRR